MAFVNARILVIIPTYNEAQNISTLLDKIFLLPGNIYVVIVDDNSKDKTSQKVKELQRKFSNLFLLTRSKKLGLGSAYRDGFSFALNKKFDIIIQMDGDLAHHPLFIPTMLKELEDCDMIIGSRYVKGGKIVDWSLSRRFLSQLGNILTRVLLKLPIYDATSGFKCFKKYVLEDIKVKTTTSEGYVFQIETTWRAWLMGFKIREIPILFEGRRLQRSKISLSIYLEALLKLLAWSWSASKEIQLIKKKR